MGCTYWDTVNYTIIIKFADLPFLQLTKRRICNGCKNGIPAHIIFQIKYPHPGRVPQSCTINLDICGVDPPCHFKPVLKISLSSVRSEHMGDDLVCHKSLTITKNTDREV